MGFVTKQTKRWEIKQVLWSVASVIMFLPLPIHLFPIIMIAQGKRAKVRQWMFTGLVFLMAELAIFASFILYFGAMSQAMLLTLSASVVSYIVGNGLLLNRTKGYLRRLELSELRELNWINSLSSQKRLELQAMTLNTPQLFIERLLHWRKEIDNKSMHGNIDRIIHLFQQLERHDPMEADKFLVRHSTVVNVLIKYDEIENSKLQNPVTAASKRKLELVIQQAATAIEQEVTNQFQTGILDLSAESEVYIQTLKNRNLLKD